MPTIAWSLPRRVAIGWFRSCCPTTWRRSGMAPCVRLAARLGLSGELRVIGEPADAEEPQTVLVAMSVAEVEGSLQVVRTAMIVGAPLLVGGFAMVCWLLVGSALRPVAALRRGAEDITTTRQAGRLPVPDADDEVRRLALTLNDMLERLERSSARQRSFVADAAHELRSPLTAIRTQLEVARAHPQQADWPQVSTDALADVERLSRLVDDLLVLARLEDGAVRPPVEAVDLAHVADKIVARTVADVSLRREETTRSSCTRTSTPCSGSSQTSSTTPSGTPRPPSPSTSVTVPGVAPSSAWPTTAPASQPNSASTYSSASLVSTTPAAATPEAPGLAWPSFESSSAPKAERCRWRTTHPGCAPLSACQRLPRVAMVDGLVIFAGPSSV